MSSMINNISRRFQQSNLTRVFIFSKKLYNIDFLRGEEKENFENEFRVLLITEFFLIYLVVMRVICPKTIKKYRKFCLTIRFHSKLIF